MKLTHHAKERMDQRNISDQVINIILNNLIIKKSRLPDLNRGPAGNGHRVYSRPLQPD